LANQQQVFNNAIPLIASRLVIAVCTLSTAACQTYSIQPALAPAPVRKANTDGDLYPLEVGTSWSYRLTQFKDGQPTGRQDTMSSRVTAINDLGTTRIAKVERTYGSMTLPATQAIKAEDGVILARWPEANDLERLGGGQPLIGSQPTAKGSIARFLPQPDSLRQPVTREATTENELTISLKILTLPLQPGDSWTGRVWTFAKETLTAQGWEQLTVPAGSYRAWHVTHRLAYEDGRTDTLGYWYAPGVGMIKAHEESTLVMGGQASKYSVDGELTGAPSDLRSAR
jgi:hypothetical protein